MVAANAVANSMKPQQVLSAIQDASAQTGVDFSYLLNKAQIESGLNCDAKAKTSSACGLYQFIDSTWLQTVRDHGAEHGLGQYATAIDANGRVSDSATKQKILDLRKDPKTAALMAAEYAKDNQDYMRSRINRPVGQTELYLAHFMGAGGATKFLQAYEKSPNASAAKMLPDAADANPSIFYDKSGNARSVKQVYELFEKKLGNAELQTADLAGDATMPATNVAMTRQTKIGAVQLHQLGLNNLTAMTQPTSLPSIMDFATTANNNAASETNQDTLGKIMLNGANDLQRQSYFHTLLQAQLLSQSMTGFGKQAR